MYEYDPKIFDIQVQKAVANYLKYYKHSTLEEIANGVVVPIHLVLNALDSLAEANFVKFEEHGRRQEQFTGGSGSVGMIHVGKFWSLKIGETVG